MNISYNPGFNANPGTRLYGIHEAELINLEKDMRRRKGRKRTRQEAQRWRLVNEIIPRDRALEAEAER